jgi:perosamine synthetase
MIWKKTQVQPYIDSAEYDLVESCFSDAWLTEGKHTENLISKVKKLSGARYALPVPNGTLGLYVALLALNLPKGSEVLVPSFTFFGSVSSIYFAGLVPRFVDVVEGDYMATAENFSIAITNKTAALMPVHIYGASVDMDPILKLAKEKSLLVIEDAAQAVGVYYKGKHCGTLGDIGVFSFFADKTVTMGEGGFVVTNQLEIFERLNLIRNQGRPNSGTFIHPVFGMNFRVTDIQAAIGCAQLDKLNEISKHKLSIFECYKKELKNLSAIKIFKPQDYSTFIPFRFAFVAEYREKLEKKLHEHGIQTRGFFFPMHLQPAVLNAFPDAYKIKHPITENLNLKGMCLPVHLGITENDVSRICEIIIKFYEK